MEEENKRFKADQAEKDRKIKELQSRLDFLRKAKGNVTGPDSGTMLTTSTFNELSILDQLKETSRIGDPFGSDNALVLEEKEE